MIIQLITLSFQRFFYLTEKVLKGVRFNGKLLRWGKVEVSLLFMEILKNMLFYKFLISS